LVVSQVHPRRPVPTRFCRKKYGRKNLYRDAARALGMPRTCPRRVLPDGRPDAGRAALREVLGFARCSPRSRCSPRYSLFHSSQMGLRRSFVIRLSPFGRFSPRNPHVRRILRFSTFSECEDRANNHPTFNRRRHVTQTCMGSQPQTIYTVPTHFPLFSRTLQKGGALTRDEDIAGTWFWHCGG